MRYALFVGGPYDGQVRHCPAQHIVALEEVSPAGFWLETGTDLARVTYSIRKFLLGETVYRVAICESPERVTSKTAMALARAGADTFAPYAIVSGPDHSENFLARG